MRRAPVSIATLCAAAAAAPVAADHFTSIDLGAVASQEACIQHASRTFDLYAQGYGQSASVSQGTWTISGWDLPPIGADVTVLCVEIGGVWNAFATGHVSGNGETPEATVEGFRDLFRK